MALAERVAARAPEVTETPRLEKNARTPSMALETVFWAAFSVPPKAIPTSRSDLFSKYRNTSAVLSALLSEQMASSKIGPNCDQSASGAAFIFME